MGCSYQRDEGQPVLGVEVSEDSTMCVDAERDGHDGANEKPNEGALQLGTTIIRHGESEEQR